MQIADKLYKGKLAKVRLLEDKETIIRQYLTEEQIRKGRYKDSLCKGSLHKGNLKNYGWGKIF